MYLVNIWMSVRCPEIMRHFCQISDDQYLAEHFSQMCNVQISQCSLLISKYPKVQISQCKNLPTSISSNVQIFQCPNIPMSTTTTTISTTAITTFTTTIRVGVLGLCNAPWVLRCKGLTVTLCTYPSLHETIVQCGEG